MIGCSNRFNETGSWLVRVDTTLNPRTFYSDSLGVAITASEVNIGLANGSDSALCLGRIPWTEADLLLQFTGLDSVYYATRISWAQVTMHIGSYMLAPPGYDVHNLQFEGYAIDSTWSSSTYTWDSVAVLPRESSNMVLPAASYVDDSIVTIPIDTGVVRRWGNATQDTNYTNHGFILKSANTSGIISVYSSSYYGTGFEPTIRVGCIKNGVSDTVTSTSYYATYVATTSITPPAQTLAVQSGTGLHANIVFALDSTRIPRYSVVNYAELTVFANPIDTLYSAGSSDSLWAYYQTDPSTHSVTSSGVALSTQVGNKYTFSVTVDVQQMLNLGNYGFMITRNEDYNNVDSRFIYDGNAPDSLKPRLSITYAPVVRRR